MPNLIQGIQSECDRCREILKSIEGEDSLSRLASVFIEAYIVQAEAAVANGDVVEMLKSYKLLKGVTAAEK